MNLFDGVRRDVSRALRDAFKPCVYTEKSEAALDPATGAYGSSSAKAHRCRALVEDYSAYYYANSLVQFGDRRMMILADTLRITPKAGDSLTIDGVTMVMIKVASDPAGATWTLQAR